MVLSVMAKNCGWLTLRRAIKRTLITGGLYGENTLTVTRQVKYDKAGNKPDLVLSVNGLPVVTVELKNPNSGQTVENAKHQYKHDRDHRELLFSV